jgi:hypothetical protein
MAILGSNGGGRSAMTLLLLTMRGLGGWNAMPVKSVSWVS